MPTSIILVNSTSARSLGLTFTTFVFLSYATNWPSIIMKDPFEPPASIVRFVEPVAGHTSLQTLPSHAHEVLAAFAFYNFIDRYFSTSISRHFFAKTYNDLPERSRTNWNAHVVSLIQSTLINSLALWVIYSDESRWEMTSGERVWGYTGAMGFVQAFSAGYFLWDLMAACWRPDVHGKGAILHALCASAVSLLGFVGTSVTAEGSSDVHSVHL